ncbi:MAG: hypothetical protein ACLSVD_16365 [Eggerthellaceae bacterium]
MSSDAPFHVMSHPDLAKKFVLPQLRPAAVVRAGCRGAAAAGRMVEEHVDHYAWREMFPRRRCWPRSAALACPARWAPTRTAAIAARDIEKAYRLMYEAVIELVTVPTADGDRRHRYRVTWDRKPSSNTSAEPAMVAAKKNQKDSKGREFMRRASGLLSKPVTAVTTGARRAAGRVSAADADNAPACRWRSGG